MGGLSAAHELAERGFEVTVSQAAVGAGGKARSTFVPGTYSATPMKYVYFSPARSSCYTGAMPVASTGQ